MPQTQIRGAQVLDGSVSRADLNTTTSGSAVTAKLIQGSGISLTSTGADAGTGDVTVAAVNPMLITTTASFTCPGFNGSVAISITATSWLKIGDKIFISGFGKFIITAVASTTSITIWNNLDVGNATSGTVASGTQITLVPGNELESAVFAYNDHFDTNSPGFKQWANQSGTGAATSTLFQDDVNHPGVGVATSGTVASNYAYFLRGNAFNYAVGQWYFRAVVRTPSTKPTSTAAQLAVMFVGLTAGQTTAGIPNPCVVFIFNPASGATNAANNWSLLCNNGTPTYTDTGLAYTAGNWYDLCIYMDASGVKYRAFVYGATPSALSAYITTQVPGSGSAFGPQFMIYNGPSGTTSYSLHLDLWEFYKRIATSVAQFRGATALDNP